MGTSVAIAAAAPTPRRADTAAAAAPPTVVVAEVFGPTLQGEGPSLGRRAAFVRLGGCNLHCTWCDTPYTWDSRRFNLRKELTRRPVADIVAQVAGMEPGLVVLTGGEPLLWQAAPGWPPLIDGLSDIAAIEVETNGTIPPRAGSRVGRYNVSPKLAHAGDPEDKRIVLPTLRRFADLAREDRAVLKIVAKTAADVKRAAALARRVGFPLSQVYVMPEGTTPGGLVRRHARLADAALTEGLNMTTRLHVLAWGTERGR